MPGPIKNKKCDRMSRNDEARMTNDELMTNDEARAKALEQISSFGFRSSFVLRHLSFVI